MPAIRSVKDAALPPPERTCGRARLIAPRSSDPLRPYRSEIPYSMSPEETAP